MTETKQRIWEQLVHGQLVGGVREGDYPLDLRGVFLPEPTIVREHQAFPGFASGSGFVELRRRKWDNIDFSGSQLKHIRFYESEFVNCVFDDCDCRGWRMWRSVFRKCAFRGADLRESAMGAVEAKQRNIFQEADFTRADLSDTGHTSAHFVRCTFKNSNLRKADFQGSVFEDCVFEGDLDRVLFYDVGFNAKDLNANELLHCDFGRARFRYVEFRRLNLDTVRFPQGDDHICFEESFPQALDVLLTALNGGGNLQSRKLAAILNNIKRWLGPKQRRGVLSKHDILNTGGPRGLEMVMELVRDLQRPPRIGLPL